MQDNYKDIPVLSDEDLPNLSMITPCYGRQHFLPLMVCNLKCFDYPQEKLTWIMYQDGDKGSMFENEEHEKYIREKLSPIKLIYKYEPRTRKSIGEKRNYCIKKLNKNKFVAMLDSDDIYLPTYPRYAVSTLKINKMGIVGSQSMLFTFPFDDYKVSAISCQSKRQIHEGTSCISMKHFNSTSGFQKSSQGEGVGLLDFCENRAKDLDITLIMVCVDHGENTIAKGRFNQEDNKLDIKLDGIHYRVLDALLKEKYPEKFPSEAVCGEDFVEIPKKEDY
tara:strand:+ start:768 stop:1601 length:834 start_codon:yes stop_codon:yes gene_type:complete